MAAAPASPCPDPAPGGTSDHPATLPPDQSSSLSSSDPPPCQEAHAEEPETLLPPVPAVAGTVLGGAERVHAALLRAQLPPRDKDLLQLLFHLIYINRPPTSARWATARIGDPWLGYVPVDLAELAARLPYQAHITNLSAQLQKFLRLGIFVRGAAPRTRWITFRDPDDWDAAVFDAAAARERHARAGAGSPRWAPPVPAGVPVDERIADRRFTAYATEDTVRKFLPGASLALIRTCWQVADHFQRSNAEAGRDEAFKPKWIAQLVELVEGGGYDASFLCAMLDHQREHYHPQYPWSYLVKTLADRPMTPVHVQQSQQQPAKGQHDHVHSSKSNQNGQNGTAQAAATSGTSQQSHKRLANATDRTRRRYAERAAANAAALSPGASSGPSAAGPRAPIPVERREREGR